MSRRAVAWLLIGIGGLLIAINVTGHVAAHTLTDEIAAESSVGLGDDRVFVRPSFAGSCVVSAPGEPGQIYALRRVRVGEIGFDLVRTHRYMSGGGLVVDPPPDASLQCDTTVRIARGSAALLPALSLGGAFLVIPGCAVIAVGRTLLRPQAPAPVWAQFTRSPGRRLARARRRRGRPRM